MTTNDITMFPLMLIRVGGLPLVWLDELAAFPPMETSSQSDIAKIVSVAFDNALTALETSTLRTGVYNARRAFFQKRKMPSPRLIRQLEANSEKPGVVQLIESLGQWNEHLNTEKKKVELYREAIHLNYRLLQRAAREDTIRRSLLFASHDLLDRLAAFAEKPVADFNKKDRQTALSLLQYLTRAVAKTSPLSRFTIVGLMRTDSEAGPGDEYDPFLKPHVTPNVALLPALYEILLREPAFYKALSASLNPCISSSPGPSVGLNKISWLYFDGEHESFQQIDSDPVTAFIIKLLLENERTMPFVQMLSILRNEVDALPEQLQSLVFELIDYGLLEWVLPEKGLSPGWCGGLYNFLAFLSEKSRVITEAAALLQWLRTAARTLPYRPVEEVRTMQHESVALAKSFFEKNGCEMPPIPPEQIFFEDVAETMSAHVPEQVIQIVAKDLAACWRQSDASTTSHFQTGLFNFAEKNLAKDQVVDFQRFCKLYFEDKQHISKTPGTSDYSQNRRGGAEAHKIGALVQIFKAASGDYKAVVNALFPGGGKLFARWLHLFPAETSELLQNWLQTAGDEGLIPFPWQGWSNANFQPVISHNSLAVPDGRAGHLRGGKQILLGDLAIKYDENGVQLIDKETNDPVRLTDLGLEAPELRPPSMKVLWNLGVPHVSLETILPRRVWKEGGPHWRYAERVGFGSLILARKTWQIAPTLSAQWLNDKSDAAIYSRIRTEMSAMGIPRRFFGRLTGKKPQYFDLDSPVTVLLLVKMLRTENSPLLLTEMLPLPEQCIVQNNGVRAAEFVLELAI